MPPKGSEHPEVRYLDIHEREEKIGSFAAQVGIPNPPTMEFFEVHNYFTPGT